MRAMYNDKLYNTYLLACWAAFFDECDWEFQTNPAPLGDWQPDFLVTFKCHRPECSCHLESHSLLIAVLPVDNETVKTLKNHPAIRPPNGLLEDAGLMNRSVDISASALFGDSPGSTYWVMGVDGDGETVQSLYDWISKAEEKWERAVSSVLHDTISFKNDLSYRIELEERDIEKANFYEKQFGTGTNQE